MTLNDEQLIRYNKMLHYMGENAGEFRPVYFHLGVTQSLGFNGRNWDEFVAEEVVDELLNDDMVVVVRPWEFNLTRSGVEYCRSTGCYLPTRQDIMMQDLLRAINRLANAVENNTEALKQG